MLQGNDHVIEKIQIDKTTWGELTNDVYNLKDEVEVDMKPMSKSEAKRLLASLLDDGLDPTSAARQLESASKGRTYRNPPSAARVAACILMEVMGVSSPRDIDNVSHAIALALIGEYRVRCAGVPNGKAARRKPVRPPASDAA